MPQRTSRANSDSKTQPLSSLLILGRLFTIGKFAASSAISCGIDLLMFTFIGWLLANHIGQSTKIFIATLVARVISSLCNYFMNRGVVFKNHDGYFGTMVRYYILAGVLILASYSLVNFFAQFFGVAGLQETIIKAIVDGVLFFISYTIQRFWVFKSKGSR